MSSNKTPRVIPGPGEVPDVERDARVAFEVLKAGGVIIAPIDTGYGLMAVSAEGIERAFVAKQRKPGHSVGVIGTYRTHQELHILPPEKFEITRVITQVMSYMIGIIAPYKKDHPRIKALSPETLERATKGDTLGIGIAEGAFLRELGRLNDEDGQLMIGSSANLTGRGGKYLVEDIEREVYECADLVVDYGLQRYHRYQRSGTIFDIDGMRVLRFGAGYEVFRERMSKWWGVDLPEDPVHKIDKTKGVGVGASVNVN
ncbi:hypothetical protein F5Y12DRAFT_166740 [Xylaria sp. FL1777]|nr:hypothetical protein F5Y12DRAFT_166740 [Xylaria sp. FL1777]